jgi:uncharacterized protein
MLWAINCSMTENAAELAKIHGKAHLAYLDAHHETLLFSGGQYSDDGSRLIGSFFIVNGANRAEAQTFIDGEPFLTGGVFDKIAITRLSKGRFNPKVVDNL